MNPLITTVSVSLDLPSASDKRADKERLLDGLVRSGVHTPVEISPALLAGLPAALRACDFSPLLTLGWEGDRARVVAINKRIVYGLAIDAGTTNIVASLFDMTACRRIAAREHENPQIAAGLDVLSRVHAAMSGRGEELHALLIDGINALIGELCSDHGIRSEDICAAVIAGNTIMMHFLLDLPVHTIPVDPYLPVAYRMDFVRPRDAGIAINDQAVVYIFPNAGSYVGGDIIAGILVSGLHANERPSLLIDVGTNAEIVLGCSEWIMVGAGAAGPALESGIAEIGMRATEGAVAGVVLEKDTPAAVLKVIGGGAPRGICGSGVIELVAELYDNGIIDGQGRLSASSPNVVERDGGRAFVLYESAGARLMIKDTDIDNFLRSKAAMFASLYVMVHAVGLTFGDVLTVYVSGAFGAGIDADKAVRIGMLPDIPRERFVALGNSSLKGAEAVLTDRGALAAVDRICGLITYREMNTDGAFMREFPAALFIPHTNPDVLKS